MHDPPKVKDRVVMFRFSESSLAEVLATKATAMNVRRQRVEPIIGMRYDVRIHEAFSRQAPTTPRFPRRAGLFDLMGRKRKYFYRQRLDFGRRINKETGKYESICMRCMATVARVERLDELEAHEEKHRCSGLDVPEPVR